MRANSASPRLAGSEKVDSAVLGGGKRGKDVSLIALCLFWSLMMGRRRRFCFGGEAGSAEKVTTRKRKEEGKKPGHVCRASLTTTRMCCGHSSILQARYNAVATTK